MAERCMGAVLPDFGGYRRIVQSPGSVSIFYDTGQGQGWQRIIPVDGSPHLPPSIRQRFGDSRGRWEGNTLVVDVTNFSPKFSFRRPARTCISSSAGRASTRTRSSTPSRSRIRRRGRSRGRSSRK